MKKIKTIGTYKGANEDETGKETLTRGRKLIEKNKHLNLHKQTKQKDENNYKPIRARKGKTNN